MENPQLAQASRPIKEAADFLEKIVSRKDRTLVLCHHNSDLDAVASATVLSETLKGMGVDCRAAAAESVSTLGKTILHFFGKEIEVDPPLDFDLVILVDTSGYGHLGDFGAQVREFPGKLAVIDHHRPVEEMQKAAEFYFVKEDYSSESELIFKIISEMGGTLSPEQASLLLSGIISDTAHFRLARPETFGILASLIEAGADYRKMIEILKTPEDPSRRIAMLKAASRSETTRLEDQIIVFSELGSFEGDAASMLVRIGADAAFVGCEDKGDLRLSGRARSEFVEKTGLHMGKFMEELSKTFNGSGGGHPSAASMNGKGKFKDMKKHLFKQLQQKIKPKT